jgi:hypothetical protein
VFLARRLTGLSGLTGYHHTRAFLEKPIRRGQTYPTRAPDDQTSAAVEPARA